MVTAAGLYTGPFPVHFCGGSWYALISKFTGSVQHERVERPGESQEALEGKKGEF